MRRKEITSLRLAHRSATEGNARWIAARGFDSPTLRKRERLSINNISKINQNQKDMEEKAIKATDFMTDSEKEKVRRHSEICRLYTSWRKQFPEMPPTRIMRKISEQLDMTVPGVRLVLIQHKYFTPNTGKGGRSNENQ